MARISGLSARTLTAAAALIAAALVGLPQPADAYHCACYINQADHSYEGIM